MLQQPAFLSSQLTCSDSLAERVGQDAQVKLKVKLSHYSAPIRTGRYMSGMSAHQHHHRHHQDQQDMQAPYQHRRGKGPVHVETPMGEEVVPDMNIVNRAKAEDLNRKVQYQ
eukprot:scaffold210207_cov21-Tisochrysis_lutea.AAC.2